jgi:type I restriction enzyme, S subunit
MKKSAVNIPKVPNLRFPGFVGEWEVNTLGEVGEIINGLTYSPNEIDKNGVLVLRSSNIQNRRITFGDNVFVKTNSFNAVLENDILICVRNGSKNLIGKNAIVKKDQEGYAFGAFMTVYRSFHNKFLFHWFDTKHYKSEVYKNLGATINSINGSDLKKFKIPFPSVAEQNHIASFLSLIDEKILTQNKIIAQLESLMRCLREKLFKQQIRFDNETGNEFPSWVWERLGNLCKTVKSGGTPQSTRREYYDGPIPFLSISDMTSQGKYLTSTVNSISQLGLDNSSSWVVPVHSIIYSMYASVGFVSINNIPLATSQAVLNLILKPNIETEFVYYYLVEFQKRISKFITTGTQANLNAETVKGFEIPVPVIEEQILIAKFLTSIDEKIRIEERISKNYEQQKKYLLQNLFI